MKQIFFFLLLPIFGHAQNFKIEYANPKAEEYRFEPERSDTTEMHYFDKDGLHKGFIITKSIGCVYDSKGELAGTHFTTSVTYLSADKKPLDAGKFFAWRSLPTNSRFGTWRPERGIQLFQND